MASAAASLTSCQRVAPRAVSIADSPSRWPASSRATASRAAAASRNSSTAQMASSERATSRSLAVPLSTAGRLVVSVRAGSSSAFCQRLLQPVHVGGDGAELAGRNAGRLRLGQPGTRVDGERSGEGRGLDGQRAVGGEAAGRARAGQGDVVQAPVLRRDLPGPVQAGDHEPDVGPGVSGPASAARRRRSRAAARRPRPARPPGWAARWPVRRRPVAGNQHRLRGDVAESGGLGDGLVARAGRRGGPRAGHEPQRIGPVGLVEGERRAVKGRGDLARQQGGVLGGLAGVDVAR